MASPLGEGFFLVFALAVQIVLTSAKVDQTLAIGAGGCQVIEAVIAKITMSSVFPPDNGFLRRIAYTETQAGQSTPSAGRLGPWAASSTMLLLTKADQPSIQRFKDNLMNSTALLTVSGTPIDWSAVTLEDLGRPLYSAIAAQLFLYLQLANQKETKLPSRLDFQAQFWADHYYPAGAGNRTSTDLVQQFLQRTRELDDQCACKASIDMAFVMDMSGSVGSKNFEKAKTFVSQIVSSFSIGPNRTKVALITYSTRPYVNFDLDKYNTLDSVQLAIQSTRYRGGWTMTGLAIRTMVSKIFNATATTTSAAMPTTQAPTTQPPTTVPTTPPATTQPCFGGAGDFGVICPDPLETVRQTDPPTTITTTQAQLVPKEIKARVGIVVTDGKAQDKVLSPSLQAQSLGITMFAIGVGSSFDIVELREIASDPDQAHIYTVGDYNAIDNIRASIRQRSCLASAPIEIGQPVSGNVNQNESTFVEMPLPDNTDITITVTAVEGSVSVFTSTSVPNPSEAIHDQKIELQEGEEGKLVASRDLERQNQIITPRRDRRQASNSEESKLYISIVGQASTNRFILQGQEGNLIPTVQPTAQGFSAGSVSKPASLFSYVLHSMTLISVLLYLLL